MTVGRSEELMTLSSYHPNATQTHDDAVLLTLEAGDWFEKSLRDRMVDRRSFFQLSERLGKCSVVNHRVPPTCA
jgi:hypothetical protein